MSIQLERKANRTLWSIFGLGMILSTMGIVFWRLSFRSRIAGISLFVSGMVFLFVGLIYYLYAYFALYKARNDPQIVVTQV